MFGCRGGKSAAAAVLKVLAGVRRRHYSLWKVTGLNTLRQDRWFPRKYLNKIEISDLSSWGTFGELKDVQYNELFDIEKETDELPGQFGSTEA
jgi:hypothetical protein